MQEALTAARINKRSAAEQLEFWADIGRRVSGQLNSDSLLEILAGSSTLKVVPVETPFVDADDVFTNLKRDQVSGKLSEQVTDATVRYQASASHPGYLEQLAEGRVTVGQFRNAVFIPLDANTQ